MDLEIGSLSHEFSRERTCLLCLKKRGWAPPKKPKIPESPRPDAAQLDFSTPPVKHGRKRGPSPDHLHPKTRPGGRRKLGQSDADPKHDLPPAGSHQSGTEPRAVASSTRTSILAKSPAAKKTPTPSTSCKTPTPSTSFKTPRKSHGKKPKAQKKIRRMSMSSKKRARSAPRTYLLQDRPDLCNIISSAMALPASFDLSRNTFAAIICSNCYYKVQKVKSTGRSLTYNPRLPDLLSNEPRMSPRTEHFHDESCVTCAAGNATGGHVFAGTVAVTPAPPQTSKPKSLPSPKLCPSCFQQIGKGLSHKCSARAALKNLTNNVDVDLQEKLAGQVVRGKMQASDESNPVVALASDSTLLILELS